MSNEPRYFNRSPQVLLIALACLWGGANNAAADLNDGLVGYWSFDEGEGSTAYDYSGNGNDGTINGASWTDGISGSALQFDGADDYVLVGTNPVLAPTQSLTASAWVQFGSVSGLAYAVSRGRDYWGSGYNLGGWGDRIHGEVNLDDAENNPEVFLLSSTVASCDKWYHIVLTYDSATGGRLYVNGAKEKSAALTGAIVYRPGQGDDFVIGVLSHHYPDWYDFEGLIDEVRIYNRALSATEIADLYWSVRPDPQEDTTEGDQTEVSGTSADPVNTATGSFFHQETDLSIPSRGSPLVFTRYYNSKAAAPGRKAAKSKQASPGPRTATSQPANAKPGKRSSVDAKKPNESPPTSKKQDQAAGSSRARPKTKEQSK